MNLKDEDYELKVGEELKVYYYQLHVFTLQELDNSSDWIYHYVVPEETLSDIAAYYSVTIDELKKANEIEDII